MHYVAPSSCSTDNQAHFLDATHAKSVVLSVCNFFWLSKAAVWMRLTMLLSFASELHVLLHSFIHSFISKSLLKYVVQSASRLAQNWVSFSRSRQPHLIELDIVTRQLQGRAVWGLPLRSRLLQDVRAHSPLLLLVGHGHIQRQQGPDWLMV